MNRSPKGTLFVTILSQVYSANAASARGCAVRDRFDGRRESTLCELHSVCRYSFWRMRSFHWAKSAVNSGSVGCLRATAARRRDERRHWQPMRRSTSLSFCAERRRRAEMRPCGESFLFSSFGPTANDEGFSLLRGRFFSFARVIPCPT